MSRAALTGVEGRDVMASRKLCVSLSCSPPLRGEADGFACEHGVVWEAPAVVIDHAGGHELLRVQDVLFLCLKAGSTQRRHLLRVPPTLGTVAQAISWVFGR
jgi:hypothetical protein